MSNKDKAIHVLKLIDSWLDFQTYIKEIPSVSVGIFMEDEVIFRKSYGYSNLETKNKATSSTLYRIGLHSKVFSTTIIMRLYAEDKLSLDDRVVKHLPWLISEKEDLSQIRIKHLLTH